MTPPTYIRFLNRGGCQEFFNENQEENQDFKTDSKANLSFLTFYFSEKDPEKNVHPPILTPETTNLQNFKNAVLKHFAQKSNALCAIIKHDS